MVEMFRSFSKAMTTALVGLISLLTLLSGHLNAEILGAVEKSHSKAALHSEYAVLGSGETHWFGLEIAPNEGWHSYWKNYGDSGAAPIFYWTLPDGVTAGEPLYPTPHRMPIGPLMNYGYETRSILLIPLTIDASYRGSSIPFSVDVEWLVCEIECVPQDATFSGELPVGDMQTSASSTALFIEARTALPELPIWNASLDVYESQSRLKLYIDETELTPLKEVYFFPAGDGITEYAAEQQWAFTEEGLFVDMKRTAGGLEASSGEGVLYLAFEDGSERAVEVAAKLNIQPVSDATTPGASSPTVAATIPLWQALVFALLGGMVLNLMPCVFPVLSLKAFSFISANAKSENERQQEGWSYTAGIWVSFMLIVAVLLIIKSGGAAIGWGFQLQEPAFVGSLVLLMILVALSLSGMFDITMGSVEGAGQELASKSGNQGTFFQGVLAALVATPCTAPLMAPAIGFALTQPAPLVFLIFSFLAIGLAFPFLALSYSPALARMMPRPGAWMETLKQALAFPMYLTAAWLLYVFNLQAGATATLALLVGVIAAIFGIWVWQNFRGRFGKVFAVLFFVSAVSGIIYQPFGSNGSATQTQSVDGIQPYSEETLAALLAQDETVFAYFTAEWCITCKVNEQVALFTDDTQALFADKGIHMLKGDWTNRNAEIAGLLAEYGRAGVPLYLLFPKGSMEAVVLPEILTPGIIADAVASAG